MKILIESLIDGLEKERRLALDDLRDEWIKLARPLSSGQDKSDLIQEWDKMKKSTKKKVDEIFGPDDSEPQIVVFECAKPTVSSSKNLDV